MRYGLLDFVNIEPGIQQVSIEVEKLFEDDKELEGFEERLCAFRNSDRSAFNIYVGKQDGSLVYRTETIVPKGRRDARVPVLLLLGNPASHSVEEKMFFSYERTRGHTRREHRFWKVLNESGIFPFASQSALLDERNMLRKRRLLNLDYDSPFCIGLATFYSMPSPATGKWAGVAGLRKLFRKRALCQIADWEKERVDDLIGNFVSSEGFVVAFQKDAYTHMRSSNSMDYSFSEAKLGRLEGACRCNPEIKLYGFPPTRLIRTGLELLRKLRKCT